VKAKLFDHPAGWSPQPHLPLTSGPGQLALLRGKKFALFFKLYFLVFSLYLTAITEWNLYEYPHGTPFASFAALHVFEFGPHVNPGPAGPAHSSYHAAKVSGLVISRWELLNSGL
jgi:hypothetical protein